MNYFNQRTDAFFEDWPSGNKRVECRFWVEDVPGKGQRMCKQTTGKPKKTNYVDKTVIVDGEDDKTYILRRPSFFGFIEVFNHAFKSVETAHASSNKERFDYLNDLIETACL